MTTETWSSGRLFKQQLKYRVWYEPREPGAYKVVLTAADKAGASHVVTSKRGARRRVFTGWRYVKRGNVVQKVRVYRRAYGSLITPNPVLISHRVADGWGGGTSGAAQLGSGTGRIQYEGNALAFAGTVPTVFTLSPTAIEKSVDSQLHQKASAVQFDGYTQWGELRETLAMLRSPLLSLREYSTYMWHAMRKRKRLKGKDLAEAISAVWLEFSFGLSPLLFGTAEIASKLVDVLRPETPITRSFSASGMIKLDEKRTYKSYTLPPGIYAPTLHYVETVEEWLRVRAGCKVTPINTPYPREARMGFNSMRQIVTQAWALLPLSFAVDWFVGVGPLLQECCPKNGKFVGSWRSTHQVIKHSYTPLYLQGKGSNLKVPYPCHFESWTDRLIRVVDVSAPGSLQLGPGLFSVSQGMSLAALAAAPMGKLWSKLPWH